MIIIIARIEMITFQIMMIVIMTLIIIIDESSPMMMMMKMQGIVCRMAGICSLPFRPQTVSYLEYNKNIIAQHFWIMMMILIRFVSMGIILTKKMVMVVMMMMMIAV